VQKRGQGSNRRCLLLLFLILKGWYFSVEDGIGGTQTLERATESGITKLLTALQLPAATG
jgi:hypothetical protein